MADEIWGNVLEPNRTWYIEHYTTTYLQQRLFCNLGMRDVPAAHRPADANGKPALRESSVNQGGVAFGEQSGMVHVLMSVAVLFLANPL